MAALLSALGTAVLSPQADATVIFVNHAATGANDGTSWTDAFVDLQDALVKARESGATAPVELWIAAGVYKPDRGSGNRFLSFELSDGMHLYGGFVGNESSRDQRQTPFPATILNGDLLG